jgi:hypothetical protein
VAGLSPNSNKTSPRRALVIRRRQRLPLLARADKVIE